MRINVIGSERATSYDFWAYVPEIHKYYHITEGTGDNLLPEDDEEGYIDYANWYSFNQLDDMASAIVDDDDDSYSKDGGMWVSKKLLADLGIKAIVRGVIREDYADHMDDLPESVHAVCLGSSDED